MTRLRKMMLEELQRRNLLGAAQEPPAQQELSSARDSHDLWRCPKCGGPMKVIERLTAAEIQLRSPPLLTSAA